MLIPSEESGEMRWLDLAFKGSGGFEHIRDCGRDRGGDSRRGSMRRQIKWKSTGLVLETSTMPI